MMGREKPTVKDGLMDENRLTKCGVRRKTRLTLPPALQRLQAQIVASCKVGFDDNGEVSSFVPRPPLEPQQVG